ncbi:MAG: monovalent cation:proton antiporter family protein [Bacillaceae bacterium]|nr:monovalent cation:proton antiporter family protein [Bacillaceae bacterium]
MHQEFNYISLLIITLLAFFIPLLVTKLPRISIPIVVGEIVAGMIVGKSGLNLISDDIYLTFLSDFGFAYLMFLSGLEIDFNLMQNRPGSEKQSLRQKLTSPVMLGIGVFVMTLGMAFIISYGLYQADFVKSVILMGLILSTTSLGVVVPILKERRSLATEFGQTILMAALIADFVTMLLITFVASLKSGGSTAETLLILTLFVAFFFIYRISKLFSRWELIEKLADATSQIRVRGAFLLILVFIALAQQMGKEVIILGAFLAGVIISLLSRGQTGKIHEKLDAIGYGFFIPIFFIMVGVNFELEQLLSSTRALLMVPILILAAYLVKLIPSLLFRFRYNWRETMSGGFLLSSRLSLIIAASAIGYELGLIDDSINSAVVLVAVITVTLSPMIFNRIAEPVKTEDEKLIVVIGVSETGVYLAKRLKGIYNDVVHLAVDQRKSGLVGETGIKRLPENKDNITEALEKLGLTKADVVVVATEIEDYNQKVAQQLAEHPRFDEIYAVIRDEDYAYQLEELGVKVVRPSMATELVIENHIRNPLAFSLITQERQETSLKEGIVINPMLIGKAIRELPISKEILILSISRDDDSIVPHGKTRLRMGDRITMVGPPEDVEEAIQLFLQS